jgi:hypothetical protein
MKKAIIQAVTSFGLKPQMQMVVYTSRYIMRAKVEMTGPVISRIDPKSLVALDYNICAQLNFDRKSFG